MARPVFQAAWRSSRTAHDFVGNMMKAAQQKPAGQRGAEYARILSEIHPSLEQNVRERAQQWVEEGETPEDATRVASISFLLARRRQIFNMMIMEWAPQEARRVIEGAKQISASPQEAAAKIDEYLQVLRPPVPIGWDKREAAFRLKEVFPSTELREYAMTRTPSDAYDIQERIKADIQRGVNPDEALHRGLTRALRDATLDRIMSQGVAAGPDYCVVASVVAGIAAAAAALVGIGVKIYGANRAEHNRRQIQRGIESSERTERARALENETVDGAAITAARNGLTRMAALATLRTMVADQRIQRSELQPAEEARFLRTFESERTLMGLESDLIRARAASASRVATAQIREDIAAIKAAAAARRASGSKLSWGIVLGVPIVGALVLGSSFLKRR